ncbi:MAG: hypothetical protein K2I03_02020 [Lachnospiraceae bacterium]|nr:hypothetical protein [Lachnospiraceae bacterium]
MYFCGDVIIMDPCNLVKEEEDWEKVLTKEFDNVELEKIGIEHYMSFGAQGEGRAKVINDNGQVIGEFCTDSTLFCILLLSDLLKYNKDFDDYNKYPGSCCVVSDFDGEITLENEGDDSYKIVGKGKNSFFTEWI